MRRDCFCECFNIKRWADLLPFVHVAERTREQTSSQIKRLESLQQWSLHCLFSSRDIRVQGLGTSQNQINQRGNGEPCCSAEVIIGRPVRHHTSRVRNRTSCDDIVFIIMLKLAGLGRLQDVRALMVVQAG